MTIGEMLGQSGILTVLGMGVVFVFLAIMIFCVSVMGKIAGDRKAGMDGNGSSEGVPFSRTGKPANNAAEVAAITAAVNNYRNENL